MTTTRIWVDRNVFSADQYELLDFGNGRKLERIGEWTLDRPCPAADGFSSENREAWSQAIARFERKNDQRMHWIDRRDQSQLARWSIEHSSSIFHLKPTPFGHVGVFPEQAPNWDWIAQRVRKSRQPPRVLNLFAYTGGSTMAAAVAGAAEVVHVDSAKNTVKWARQNAQSTGLGEAPIRWIVEDALRFVKREVKRGRQYDAVILDPPTYGHGPKGETWKLGEDLVPLLEECAKLTQANREFVLLTSHSPNVDAAEAEALLAQTLFGHCGAGARASEMSLVTSSGRRLNAGVAARWPA